MTRPTIAQAIKLVKSGLSHSSSYTYYLPHSIPSYASGRTEQLSTTSGVPGTYTFVLADSLDVNSTVGEQASSRAFTSMNNVSSVSFTYLNNESADIVIFGLTPNLYYGSFQVAGFAYYPGMTGTALDMDLVITSAGNTPSATDPSIPSSDLLNVTQHELLHTMGLLDVTPPVAPPVYTGDEDTGRYTIMSYTNHPGEGRRPTELQIYDIAALQSIYGRNDGYHDGNDVIDSFSEISGDYSGHDRIYSIWDGGGEDEIDDSSLVNSALIDLRPGYFSSIGPDAAVQVTGGPTPVVVDPGKLNISIAFGAYIENAIGTDAGDLIIGNLLSNRLDGGEGADVIYAEGIDSIHDVGDGDYDRVGISGPNHTENAPTEIQAFISDPAHQSDHLLGGAGDDYLRGGRGDDLIEGGSDNDFIVGSGGDDTIWGGEKDSTTQGPSDGTDTVDYSANAGRITINFNGADTMPSLTVEDGVGGTDTLHSIERIVGTSSPDYLYFRGSIPAGYTLTIDAGEQQGDVVANARGSWTDIKLNIDGQGDGTLTSPEGGTINLENFTTQIFGSLYDDEITDLSEHDGLKRIDGNDGDDEITVDGSDAMIRGGWDNDTLTGGTGNDILFGDEGEDVIHGGAGNDYLETRNANMIEWTVNEDDELFGDDGHDYLRASADSFGAVLSGGAGNDVIDARGSRVTVMFGEGDGHDLVMSDRAAGDGYGSSRIDGISRIDMTTVARSGVTLIWDPQYVVEDIPPVGNPTDIPGELTREGDLAIRIDATGDTIVIRNVRGMTTYWDDPSEASQPPFDGTFDRVDFFELAELIEFSDGYLDPSDFLGANPLVSLQFGSVAAYATALDDYQDGVAAAPGANDGTSGADDLRGSRGDDEISGGDGDDSFHSSGGNDTIDGGDGYDVLNLFGSRYDFAVTSVGAGVFSIQDPSGLEGTITVSSIEAVYFTSSNEQLEAGDFFGYYGTAGDDNLTGSTLENQLFGLGGNDTLSGLGGDDTIDGGDGHDVARYAGNSTDFLIYNWMGSISVEDVGEDDCVYEGYDTLIDVEEIYFSGDDVTVDVSEIPPFGTIAADTIVGTNRMDLLNGLEGNDVLEGLAGDDILIGGDGNDTLNGGDGDDVAIFTGARADYTVSVSGGVIGISDDAPSIDGDDGTDTLIGIETLQFSDGQVSLAELINEAPVAAGPFDPLVSDEDVEIDLALPAGSFVDPDDDELEISAAMADGNPLPGWLAFDGNRFTGTPPADFNGSLALTLTASDGILTTASALEIRITPVNDAPTVQSPFGDTHVAEGEGVDLPLPGNLFVDIDGDALTLEAALQNGDPLPLWLEFDEDRFFGTPPANFNGSIELRVTASDGTATVSHDFSLIIDPVNNAPEVQEPIDDVIWRAGVAQQLTLAPETFDDADDDQLTVTAELVNGSPLPTWLSFDSVNLIFSGTAPSGATTVAIRVTASDGQASTSDLFNINVIGPFTNTINGTSGNNTLTGTSSADEIYGLGGDDTLKGVAGNDLLDGGDGNDRLAGGAGADTLIGGSGFDWADYSTNGAAIVIDLYDGSQTTGDAVGDIFVGIESYVGTNYADTFIAGATATTFDGGGSNFATADTVDYSLSTTGISLTLSVNSSGLVQGTGSGGLAAGDVPFSIERFIGTSHDDVYTITGSSTYSHLVAFVESANGGDDEVRTDRSSYTLGSNIEELTYIGTGNFTGTGNSLDNILTGGDGNDRLAGGAGADTLVGGGGFDWADYSANGAAIVIDLYDGSQSTGDAVGDTYVGIESYVGTNYADTFIAGATATTFDGGSSNFSTEDTVDYSLSASGISLTLNVDSNNLVQGTGSGGLAASDILYSIERFIGTAHDDVYTITGSSSANSIVFVEAVNGGDDEVRTDRSSYTLGSNIEELTFIGTGNFVGTGNGLDNILTGGNGNDRLAGGAGADTLVGGGGFDWADYSANGAAIVIDLYDGSQSTGDAVGDAYVGIESYIGTSYADTFIAGATATTFDGGSSNFSTADTVDYSLSTTGISLTLSVNSSGLVQGTGSGGLATGDVPFSIERFIGTSHDDVYTITGSSTYSHLVAFVESANGGDDEVRTDRSSYTLGSNVEELTYIGTGNFTGTGNSLDNILTGGDGNDRLAGGAGADTLVGGSGIDVAVFVGDQADYSIVTSGGAIQIVDNQPTVDGDDGTDTVLGVEKAEFDGGVQVNLAAPVVLDLDGDGIHLREKSASGTGFDWDDDGIRDHSGWIDPGDGFLTLDRNGDHRMSGAEELSFVDDKPGAKSDFDGLSAFDSNGDGRLSETDSRWSDFHIWRDANGDGIADAEEYLSMEEAGISSIGLSGSATSGSWGWGSNIVVNYGSFDRTDGTSGQLADVALSYDSGTDRDVSLPDLRERFQFLRELWFGARSSTGGRPFRGILPATGAFERTDLAPLPERGEFHVTGWRDLGIQENLIWSEDEVRDAAPNLFNLAHQLVEASASFNPRHAGGLASMPKPHQPWLDLSASSADSQTWSKML